MLKKTTILVLAILTALPAVADRVEVSETRSARSDGEVSVELLTGTITVIGWDRNEVSVKGTIDDRYQELEVDSEDGEVSIEVDIDEKDNFQSIDRGADLTIRVPVGSELDIEAISADITVENVDGEVNIEAISGSIECRGGMKEIEIECVSGDVTVETSAELSMADIETVSGDVELIAALGSGARISVESVNGSIVLRLPSQTSARFEVSTFNGSIRNDFGPEARKTSEHLPARELNFTLGSGSARVSIEAFNGTVRLIED